MVRAVFFGLGSDGTVGANKNSVKIIAEDPAMYAQGYFVYDSHKSGAQTVSHLRFGRSPIKAPYLIQQAHFVAVHQFAFFERSDVLRYAAPAATLLINSPYGAGTWDALPRVVQAEIVRKRLRVFAIDAGATAQQLGLGGRVNTILQTCFFALSGVLPRDQAIARIKTAIEHSYGRRGREVVERNFEAVDGALANLHEIGVPAAATSTIDLIALVPQSAPAFVREVTAAMLAGRGDDIPVGKMPADGTYPVGTSVYEKRNVSDSVAAWDPEVCVQCGQCSFACPHAVIRAKYFRQTRLDGAPAAFASAPINVRGFPDVRYALAVYVEDCTGCGNCVEVCPATSPSEPGRKAIGLVDKEPILAGARASLDFFESLRYNDRSRVDFSNVRGVQFLEPLFAFPGACAGCGETPYLRTIAQLFGDRMQIANATGCSSIYGGNLPVTPWAANADGRGPAWSNSLFEDNAEFGLGFRLAADKHLEYARALLAQLVPEVGERAAAEILDAEQIRESDLAAQQARVAALKERLREMPSEAARELLSVADHLVRRSVWIVGGDGWAYDIGFGGLDHVLATGRDLNVLVLDTELYSNTGGQASKATPLGAVAKFASGGKRTARKDLALQAIAYGNVYVAQVAMGADPQQTLLALREAEAYDGPSLVLAYSPCIAHGYDLRQGPHHQALAVASGYWPLFRFNPVLAEAGKTPFCLDSPRPSIPFREYAYTELRYRSLAATRPDDAKRLLDAAQRVVLEKYREYEALAERGAAAFHPVTR